MYKFLSKRNREWVAEDPTYLAELTILDESHRFNSPLSIPAAMTPLGLLESPTPQTSRLNLDILQVRRVMWMPESGHELS